IADFSEALATETPSGIQSEQMAVDSITRTLEADVPKVERLKILIHGQEVETLAGHLDLTGTFLVDTTSASGAPSNAAPPATATPAIPSGTDKPAAPAPAADKSAQKPSAAPLTPDKGPGKLAQPNEKPH
ncbi:MAG: hypothetical protein WA853_04950, partial [Candidatus Acidiferrum sp.]